MYVFSWIVCVQIARYLKYVRSSNDKILSTLYNEWQVLKSQVPKGFEKYYPGGKKTQAKPEEGLKSETKGLCNALICVASLHYFYWYCVCIIQLHPLNLVKFMLDYIYGTLLLYVHCTDFFMRLQSIHSRGFYVFTIVCTIISMSVLLSHANTDLSAVVEALCDCVWSQLSRVLDLVWPCHMSFVLLWCK